MTPAAFPVMTIVTLGHYKELTQAKKPSNVVPLRKQQPTAQQVRLWQINNPSRA